MRTETETKRVNGKLSLYFNLCGVLKTNLFLKRFLMVQNFSKALRIRFIPFNLSSFEKDCWRFKRFRLALFKNHS